MKSKHASTAVCKGLICGFGDWANAFRPAGRRSAAVEWFAQIPAAAFTLSCLKSAGVGPFMLAAEAAAVAQFQDALGDGSRFGTKLSYALIGEDADLAQSLAAAGEFLSQSPVAIAGAGIFISSAELDSRLPRTVQANSGLTIVEFARGRTDSLERSIAIADRRSHEVARRVLDDAGTSAGISHMAAEYRRNSAFATQVMDGECFLIEKASPKQLNLAAAALEDWR